MDISAGSKCEIFSHCAGFHSLTNPSSTVDAYIPGVIPVATVNADSTIVSMSLSESNTILLFSTIAVTPGISAALISFTISVVVRFLATSCVSAVYEVFKPNLDLAVPFSVNTLFIIVSRSELF
jgi:hypothetical protein